MGKTTRSDLSGAKEVPSKRTRDFVKENTSRQLLFFVVTIQENQERNRLL